MKNRFLVLVSIAILLLFSACSSSKEAVQESSSKEKVNLIIDYSFAGIENGFDHQIKLEAFADSLKIGETTPHLQSEAKTVSFEIDKGKHKVNLTVWVNYNGSWEEHIKSKDYAIDAVYETESEFNSDQSIKLLFDLDKGAIREYN